MFFNNKITQLTYHEKKYIYIYLKNQKNFIEDTCMGAKPE